MERKKYKQALSKILASILMFTGFYIVTAQEGRMGSKNSPPSQPPSRADTLLQALPSIDIEYLKTIQGVKHTLPVCDYLFSHVDEIPAFSDNVFQSFIKSLNNIPELFHYTYSMLSSRAGGYGPPLRGAWKGKKIKTEVDIDNFFELEGVGLIHPEEWNKLPFEFRKGILEFLFYIDRSKTTIDLFINPVVEHLNFTDDSNIEDIHEKLMTPWNHRELQNWETIEAIGLADEKKISYASRIASEKLSWFIAQTQLSIPDDFTTCTITSCMGECIINGTGNDTIKGSTFCVIELGGDDVYMGNTASPASIKQPVGIVIDFKGNDKYLCDDNFLVAGVLGLALLMDLSGDDYYRTNRPGLSLSVYGSSMLYDYSGDDVYTSDSHSQASSYVGTSVLIDISGNDQYNTSSYSQGYGGTKGVSVFYDGMGNDFYNSSTNQETHISFVQGAAQGRWAESTDGQSIAGGIGIFLDKDGIDYYFANSFSQGASYYFGLGVFSDGGGKDTYNSTSHSQGYAVHYSLASFIEKSGDDIYNKESDKEKLTQIIGGGRDNSAGLFIDHKGDDTYYFGNRSAGIGDLNGIGLLADYEGKDTYNWNRNGINPGSPSLGKNIEEGFGLGISFKIIPQKKNAKGLFFDSNGDGISKY